MKYRTDDICGEAFVLKRYNRAMRIVLKDYGQTQAEAAAELGISRSTFYKIYRLRMVPDFTTPDGKILAAAFERWSTVPIEWMFPRAYFTKEYFQDPKTHEVGLPFRLLANRIGKGDKFPIALLEDPVSTQQPPTQAPTPVKRRRKRRKKGAK